MSENNNWCPHVRGDCKGSKCKFWTHLLGKDPQSTATVDKFDCLFVFLPLLLVENAQMSHQTTAAVESFRNKLVDGVMQLAVATHNQAFPNSGKSDLGLPPGTNLSGPN